MFVRLYGNDTIIWREKERSRIRAVQMDNLRGLLGIRKMVEYRMHGSESYAKWRNGLMKGLVKVFSIAFAILKEWRLIGLLKGCMWESCGRGLVC